MRGRIDDKNIDFICSIFEIVDNGINDYSIKIIMYILMKFHCYYLFANSFLHYMMLYVLRST